MRESPMLGTGDQTQRLETRITRLGRVPRTGANWGQLCVCARKCVWMRDQRNYKTSHYEISIPIHQGL